MASNYLNISSELYSYSGAKRFSELGEPQDIEAWILVPYVQDKLIPFLNTICDEDGFKNGMISLNRHCRVFEEIILQDCLKVNSIEPARKWLDEMSIIDSASALSIAETFFNQYTKTYLEKLGFHTFEDVYNEVKNAVNETNRIFFLKLINAVETGDYKWIAPVISIEQEKSNTFFERYFNIRF